MIYKSEWTLSDVKSKYYLSGNLTKNDNRKIGLSIGMIHIVDNLCTLKFETKQIWLERCTDIGLKVIL